MTTLAPLPDVTPAPAQRALVADYATAVRLALDDLSVETVDDLTDGLEADLLDALADLGALGVPGERTGSAAGPTTAEHGARSGGAVTGDSLSPAALAGLFGAPAEYADELRSAAGLAPRPDPSDATAHPARARRPLRTIFSEARASLITGWRELRHSARWSPVFDFLASLRPVWWMARGWVLATGVMLVVDGEAGYLPHGVGPRAFTLAVVVVSAQWGRGRWRPTGRLSWVIPALSVAAVVLILPVAVAASSGDTGDDFGAGYEQGLLAAAPIGGVWVGGEPVNNLFVYDATGKLVPEAQVYDDRGQPVTVQDAAGDDSTDGPIVQLGDQGASWQLAPTADANGSVRWNVFPLRGVRIADDGTDEPSPGATPKTLAPPFERAPALPGQANRSTVGPKSRG